MVPLIIGFIIIIIISIVIVMNRMGWSIMYVGHKERANTKIQKNLSKFIALNACDGCDLSGVDLSGANLQGASLYKANLENANLENANLTKAFLREANLSGADLAGADLINANLTGAKLQEAALQGADLSWADLTGAKLNNADLLGTGGVNPVIFCNTKTPWGLDSSWGSKNGCKAPKILRKRARREAKEMKIFNEWLHPKKKRK